MLQFSKQADERREAGPLECWCLHGAVGQASDWRDFAGKLAASAIGSRAVDLWRFLESGPLSLPQFGKALNGEAVGEVFRGNGRALLGYSMGGRLALHALLETPHCWDAAIIVSAHPGLETPQEIDARRAVDTQWATHALMGDWRQFLQDWEAQPLLAGAAIRDPEPAQRLQASRREVARSFVDWSLAAQIPLWERLHEIRIPVLWVVGEQDWKFRELAERAAPLLSQGELAVAPQAGHRVPWENANWLVERVARFLKAGPAVRFA